MRDLIKEMISYALLIAVSVFMLFVFFLIGRYGIAVYEPNKIILIAEIILCVAMLALGIERLRNFVKRFKRRE